MEKCMAQPHLRPQPQSNPSAGRLRRWSKIARQVLAPLAEIMNLPRSGIKAATA
jgi:hypothetical protein